MWRPARARDGGLVTIDVTPELRDRIRSAFPALAGDTVFLENAGGSQVPAVVAERIRDYMVSSYVQLGAGYPLSQRATAMVDEAHDFVRLLFNGADGEVILGPSTSALLQMLANSYSKVLTPGDEIVVARIGHEANVGPWTKLAALGIEIKWWEMDTADFTSPLGRLEELLSERTALVAFPHV
jgi:selenocysteine lyase/cysteine desulfurase